MDHGTAMERCKNYKEVAILSRCTHPNIVKYFDCYQYGNELWLSMTLLSGGTLSELPSYQAFSENEIAYVAREVSRLSLVALLSI